MSKIKLFAFVDHRKVPVFFQALCESSNRHSFIHYQAMQVCQSINSKQNLRLGMLANYEEWDIYELPNFLFHLVEMPTWGQSVSYEIDIYWFGDLPQQNFEKMDGPFGMQFTFHHHKMGDTFKENQGSTRFDKILEVEKYIKGLLEEVD